MKQTAVEWQFEQLFNSFEKFNNREYSFNEYLKRNLEIREQAKEMEKQQIIDALKAGVNFEIDYGNSTKINYNKYSEQYYKETFNK